MLILCVVINLRELLAPCLANPQRRNYDYYRWGGGGGGVFELPASHTLYSRFPPLLLWFRLCAFSVAKYYAVLRNIFLFLPVPALFSHP